MDLKNEIQYLKFSTDPVAFITDILDLECKSFHKEWIDLIDRNNFVSLLAPRSHGKTTILGGYIVWRIVSNPDIRVLLVTINQDKANEIMTFIQKQLEHNEKIIKIFGFQKGNADWSKSTIRVSGASMKKKEPTLQVLGVSSSMVGGHYDLIILDDITDQKNSRTEYRRKELVRWFNSTLMPMLEPGGSIVSIGTKWHQDDIHSYLQRLKEYESRVYKAIIKEPDDEGKGSEVLWPDRYSYAKLNSIRKTYGNVAFMMQYQNEYISDEESPIKMDWVQSSTDNYRMVIPPYKTFMGVDLASAGEEGDFFSITIVAEKEGFFYALDGYRGHITLNQQFQKIINYYLKWEPVRIGIEQAAQQKSIIEHLMEEHPSLPVIPIKSSMVSDRMSRVMRLSVLFETGRIFINPRLTTLVDELLSFPRGSHDDTIDSLSFAIQSTEELEEVKEVNWDLVADVTTARKFKQKSPTSRKMWNIIKV